MTINDWSKQSVVSALEQVVIKSNCVLGVILLNPKSSQKVIHVIEYIHDLIEARCWDEESIAVIPIDSEEDLEKDNEALSIHHGFERLNCDAEDFPLHWVFENEDYKWYAMYRLSDINKSAIYQRKRHQAAKLAERVQPESCLDLDFDSPADDDDEKDSTYNSNCTESDLDDDDSDDDSDDEMVWL